MRLVGGAACWLHRDHLASVTVITNASGAAVTRRDYLPYGEIETDDVTPGTTPESKAFIGERYDPETGLLDLHARYYDPRLGLFTQPDWWDPADPAVGTNRYAYAFGDPVNLDTSKNRYPPTIPVLGGVQFRRFDAHPDIANAWDRMTQGTHSDADLKLMRHELAEAAYERAWGSSAREAQEGTKDDYPSGIQ